MPRKWFQLHSDFSMPRYQRVGQAPDVDIHTEKRNWHSWKAGFFTLLALYSVSAILAIQPIRGGKELSSVVPRFATKQITFSSNATFEQDIPGVLGSAWDALLPESNGFIEVSNPSRFKLTGGYPLPGLNGQNEAYCLSVFHQLHCLAKLKQSYHGLQKAPNSPEALKFHEHADHCWDYLRQAIMCNADVTLERAVVKDGEAIPVVDGMGVEHTCMDWTQLIDFVEAHGPRLG